MPSFDCQQFTVNCILHTACAIYMYVHDATFFFLSNLVIFTNLVLSIPRGSLINRLKVGVKHAKSLDLDLML
jgi:hypothetical protein